MIIAIFFYNFYFFHNSNIDIEIFDNKYTQDTKSIEEKDGKLITNPYYVGDAFILIDIKKKFPKSNEIIKDTNIINKNSGIPPIEIDTYEVVFKKYYIPEGSLYSVSPSSDILFAKADDIQFIFDANKLKNEESNLRKLLNKDTKIDIMYEKEKPPIVGGKELIVVYKDSLNTEFNTTFNKIHMISLVNQEGYLEFNKAKMDVVYPKNVKDIIFD